MDDWYQDDAVERSEPRSHAARSWLKEMIQIILIVALVRIGMDTFLPRYVVDGASMQPNFATSQRVIVDRLTMMISGPARGDVIVLDSPQSTSFITRFRP